MRAVRASIYCRISQDRGGEALGVARQEQDCRRIADERGWNVVDVLVDNDLSASKRSVRRPAYEQLLEAISSRSIDAVIVWDLDRLTRQPRELEAFVDTCEQAGMRQLATVSGDVNLGSGDGLLVARIKGAVAAEEARKLSQRIKRKKLELAEKGKPAGGGQRPFGFLEDRSTHHSAEASALREVAAMILAGGTLQAACDHLDALGLVPASGGWHPSTLRRILIGPRIAGLRQHHGVVLGDATWMPIVGREQWLELRAEISGRYRYTRPYRAHLLTGIAVCGQDGCGAALRAQVTSRRGVPGGVQYSCYTRRGGCGRLGVAGVHLEKTVIDKVGGWLVDPDMIGHLDEVLAGSTQHVDEEQLDNDRRLLEQLAAMAGAGEITLDEWRTARAPVAERVAAAEAVEHGARQRARHLEGVSVAELAPVWFDLDRSVQRAVLGVLVDRVIVLPVGRTARRFDPERVQVKPA